MRLLLFVAFMIITSHLAGQDKSMYLKKEFTGTQGLTMPYRILYPKVYDADKRYPLVVLLHGAGERGTDNEKQLVYGAELFLNAEHAATFPCIVIAPQCPETSYWASVQFDRKKLPLDLDFDYSKPETPAFTTLIELIKQVVEKERVDKKRMYLIGISMGAMGTLEALYRNRRMFAAAVAICGGGDTKSFTKKYTHVPLWLFHGTADNVVPVKHSREMEARFKKLDAVVKYTEYNGVGHDSWHKAFADTDLLPWLFFNSRN